MPALAGMQGGSGWKYAKPGFPRPRERRKRESRLRVEVNKIPRLQAAGRLVSLRLPCRGDVAFAQAIESRWVVVQHPGLEIVG